MRGVATPSWPASTPSSTPRHDRGHDRADAGPRHRADPTILSDKAIIDAPADAGIPAFVVEKCRPLHQALLDTLEIAFARGVTIAAGNDGGAPLVHIGTWRTSCIGTCSWAWTLATRSPARPSTPGVCSAWTMWPRGGRLGRGPHRGPRRPALGYRALKGPAFVMARGAVAVTPDA